MPNVTEEIEIKCEKCGKPAPIDTEKSNDNFIAYNLKEPCECGGFHGKKD